ncbi:MAG TPA: hypothetical protein VMO20_04335 [Candidatus Acidoferrum sp.]|nr:hypothetical protein [Candidatus Acidoferrum sp.]
MASLPNYFIILAGVSLHIIYHQQNHVAQVMNGRATLNPVLLLLVNIIAFVSLLALLGLSIYFGVKLGWFIALKFVCLAILAQFVFAIIVFSLRFQKHAWGISISGIFLLPILIGTMVYVSLCG